MNNLERLSIMLQDLLDYTSEDRNGMASYIFHYTSPLNIENILKEDKIHLRFTKSDCLNDTTEGYFVDELFVYAAKSLYELGEITKRYRNFLDDIYSIANNAYKNEAADKIFLEKYEKTCLDNRYFLCCFSKDDDSLPLWNYYVKERKYEGFNIGFDPRKIEKAKYRKDTYNILVAPVKYSGFFEDCMNLIKEYSAFHRFADEKNEAKLAILFSCFLEKYRLFVKNQCFKHENEVRAVLNLKKQILLMRILIGVRVFPDNL